MGTFTDGMARFIRQLTFEQNPLQAIEKAKQSILDCLAVALAGNREEASQIVSEFIRGSGKPEAGVIGGKFKAAMDEAAWVNGTKVHALDYDDYFSVEGSTPYHPTVAILPAVLAAGEKIHASGREVLTAYVTGFEVAAKLALVCAQPQYDLGWHTTATIGCVGAAAGVARMLRLDEAKIKTTLGIASSLAGGLRKNFGTMTKPLHAGNASRNGVIAALLAQAGFTADSHILDSPLSFGEVLSGAAGPHLDKIDEALQAGFYLVSPGAALKPYPSCAYSHWAIDAALALRKETRLILDDLAEIECQTSSGLPKLLIHSHPRTGLEGKFSMEFCVAISLIDGEATLREFTDEKVDEPAVWKLMQKVRYVHPPDMGTGLINLRGRLVAKLLNGQTFSHQVNIAKGDPRNPLTRDELIGKYHDCVQPFLPPKDVEKSLDMLMNLEGVKDIAELMEIFTFRVEP